MTKYYAVFRNSRLYEFIKKDLNFDQPSGSPKRRLGQRHPPEAVVVPVNASVVVVVVVVVVEVGHMQGVDVSAVDG